MSGEADPSLHVETAEEGRGGGGASLHVGTADAARRAEHLETSEAAYASALAALPGAGAASLRRALAEAGGPAAAWEAVLAGRVLRPPRRDGGPASSWAEVGRHYDVAGKRAKEAAAGIQVTWYGHDRYPAALLDDPSPPAVLFWRGDLGVLSRPCVALVGTRRATPGGREMAYELGRDLAAAGVCVVSGLALGIDGAAHRGALAAGPAGTTVGIAASGVDRVYPRRHTELWAAVAAAGAVTSETPPGRDAEGWRFPARNRIIAGLVSMVVVVESHATGGSLITADAAIERGVEVRAVPGPVRSPASAGTNQLLFDGPGPVRDAGDILEALEMAGLASRPEDQAGRRRVPEAEVPPSHRVILEAVGWEPTSFSRVVARSGVPLAEVAGALESLADVGLVVREGDWWQRRR